MPNTYRIVRFTIVKVRVRALPLCQKALQGVSHLLQLWLPYLGSVSLFRRF
jgi:hypothetical protein